MNHKTGKSAHENSGNRQTGRRLDRDRLPGIQPSSEHPPRGARACVRRGTAVRLSPAAVNPAEKRGHPHPIPFGLPGAELRGHDPDGADAGTSAPQFPA